MPNPGARLRRPRVWPALTGEAGQALRLSQRSELGILLGWGSKHYWLAALGAVACSSPSPPTAIISDPPVDDSGSGGRGGASGNGCVEDATAPPSPDAEGFCGNTFLQATADPPNLYFVIDRSGSMQEIVDGRQKYDAVASAAVTLVRKLGPSARVGAGVFPGQLLNPDDACTPGGEVFVTRPGDPADLGACVTTGPVTRGFSASIAVPSGMVPLGGTPTSPTLTKLLPLLAGLPGRTAVILATDGGPNCNPHATCDESRCIPNIEQDPNCPSGVNCCTPALYGPTSCLDDIATLAAVTALANRGIKTYVVGIPGTAPYVKLLDQMAIAGGTARQDLNGSKYYDVNHLAELDSILAAIGSKVVLSCHLHLDPAPKEQSLVNVYLDKKLVEYGTPDGWIWTNTVDAGPAADGALEDASEPDDASDAMSTDASLDDVIVTSDAAPEDDTGAEASSDGAISRPSRQDLDLRGASCESLLSGKVRQVQVVFGCPTVTPK